MAKIKKIEHIGVAIDNPETAANFWKTLGLQLSDTEIVASDHVKTHFYPTGEAKIELLEATAAASPITKFLEKRGPGLHHICFDVEDLPGILKNLQAAGIRLIDSAPRLGAHGRWVAFVHPASTGGVLIELSEAAKDSHAH